MENNPMSNKDLKPLQNNKLILYNRNQLKMEILLKMNLMNQLRQRQTMKKRDNENF